MSAIVFEKAPKARLDLPADAAMPISVGPALLEGDNLELSAATIKTLQEFIGVTNRGNRIISNYKKIRDISTKQHGGGITLVVSTPPISTSHCRRPDWTNIAWCITVRRPQQASRTT